jgi:hypothetical protein
LAFLIPPPFPRARSPRPARGAALAAGLGVLAALLCFVLAFWYTDGRSGKAKLAADSGEFAAGAGSLGTDAIIVPVGPLLDVQYADALAAPRTEALLRMPPSGWVVATPALGEFLKQNGFASGRAFMQGLVTDRRVVFVVRRALRHEAEWLVGQLNERYAPGERLVLEPLEPLGPPAGGPGYLFFRIRTAPGQARSGMVTSTNRA